MKLLDKTERKSMPALTVFSAAIAHMKAQFTEVLRKQGTLVEPSDITWVLTLPAIWEDQAKQFMREAAKKVGEANSLLFSHSFINFIICLCLLRMFLINQF